MKWFALIVLACVAVGPATQPTVDSPEVRELKSVIKQLRVENARLRDQLAKVPVAPPAPVPDKLPPSPETVVKAGMPLLTLDDDCRKAGLDLVRWNPAAGEKYKVFRLEVQLSEPQKPTPWIEVKIERNGTVKRFWSTYIWVKDGKVFYVRSGLIQEWKPTSPDDAR